MLSFSLLLFETSETFEILFLKSQFDCVPAAQQSKAIATIIMRNYHNGFENAINPWSHS